MKFPVGTCKANIGAVLLLLALIISKDASALEKPEYEVLFEDGKIEYRLYDPYLVVETEVAYQGGEEAMEEAMEAGFDRLFAYISGKNRQQTKVSMTAPVEIARTGMQISPASAVQSSVTANGIRMAFMLPGEFSMDTAPIPRDSTVQLRLMPERVVAAIRFSGRWTERNLVRNETKLIEDIRQRQLTTRGPSVFAAYHPPFMPPFLRRNEILFELNGNPRFSNLANAGD